MACNEELELMDTWFELFELFFYFTEQVDGWHRHFARSNLFVQSFHDAFESLQALLALSQARFQFVEMFGDPLEPPGEPEGFDRVT